MWPGPPSRSCSLPGEPATQVAVRVWAPQLRPAPPAGLRRRFTGASQAEAWRGAKSQGGHVVGCGGGRGVKPQAERRNEMLS